jgi:rod shape-determining protein MreC
MSRPARDDRRARGVLVLLALAAVTVMTVDASGGEDSPVSAARSATGEVLGPVQTGLDAIGSPFGALADRLGSDDGLRAENERLEAENAELRSTLETAGLDVSREQAQQGMSRFAEERGLVTVTAEVVAYGPAQNFSRTVTIDRGTADGVQADMTVLNADGLVGRVVRADTGTATVLLVVDSGSVVGGRLGADLELGFLSGDGDLSDDGRLILTTMDPRAVPSVGDSVLTWGSQDGRPYVSGVPIGSVLSVEASPRDQTATAVIAPYVDFSALDLVQVIVGASSPSSDQAGGARTRAGG